MQNRKNMAIGAQAHLHTKLEGASDVYPARRDLMLYG
jgi:hypothetical protein